MIRNFTEYDKLFNPDQHERIIYLYMDHQAKDFRLHLAAVGDLRSPYVDGKEFFPIATASRLSKIIMDISLRIYEDTTLFRNVDELNHDEIIPFSFYPYGMEKAYVVNLKGDHTIGGAFTVARIAGSGSLGWIYYGGEKNGMKISNDYIIKNKYALFCLPYNKIEKITKQIQERNS